MPANIILVVERMVDQSSAERVRAWTQPGQRAPSRVARRARDGNLGVCGWAGGIITTRSATTIRRCGSPPTRCFTEICDPDVFVARQAISGDPGIDPGRSRRHHRIIQSPDDEAVAHTHSQGWERELT
jgi:Hepatitis C virus capsid protein